MSKLVCGSDPEFMLIDQRGGLKSSIGIVNGTKEEKIDLGNGNKLFCDNVLAEVNINPADSADGLVASIATCLKSLYKVTYPYRPLLQASATYPAAECKHPDAQVFGCEPEFCAYEMNIVQAPECKTTFRSAGGHVHLGYSDEKWPLMAPTDDGGVARAWGRVWVIRMMDLFVGIPSLWLDQDPNSPARRRLYGKAGTHRPKDLYGVEYRATSNFWLRSPSTVQLMYNLCNFVVGFVADNKHKELWKIDDADFGASCSLEDCKYDVNALRDAINNSDKKAASVFLNEYVKKYMPTDLYAQVLTECEPVQNNFYREWGLA